MKPGDFIEWVYKSNNSVVRRHRMMWSTLMQKDVPIGGLNLLVALTGDTMVWLCDKGLFHARVDDTYGTPERLGRAEAVVPRALGDAQHRRRTT
jgi:hypothetical protein